MLTLLPISQAQIAIGPVETDPRALEKMARGELDKIDNSDRGMRDLTAVLQGLISSGCQYEARPGDAPVNMARIMERIQQAGTAIGPLIMAHKAYGETLIFVTRHGCTSDQVHRLEKTLFAAIMAPPPPPPPEPRLVEPTLQAQEIRKWWAYAWGVPNPGGRFEAVLGDAQVLLCHYHSPSNYSAITRIAWFDTPPATSNELRRLSRSHPIGELNGLRLEKCPRRIGDFDAARKQAG
ncbi:MAG: hypothetical protein AD742_05820 [Methylibium sp. NZG]|nr:MAG: hypothetical protein AD742_05820 [Methylibium sp. NZG]